MQYLDFQRFQILYIYLIQLKVKNIWNSLFIIFALTFTY